MAAAATFYFFLWFLIPGVSSQLFEHYTDYIDPSSCRATVLSGENAQYFDGATLSCADCGETQQRQSSDGLTCVCNPGYRYEQNFGGSEVRCIPCPQAVSKDGWECVSCPPNSNFNNITKECDECPTDTIEIFRELDGQNNGNLRCATCQDQTQLSNNRESCELCSTTLSLHPSLSTCQCSASQEKLNGICFETSEIKKIDVTQIPLTSSSSTPSVYMSSVNINVAFIMCTKGNSTACQHLANLCMLLYYSQDRGRSQPCNLFNDQLGQNDPKPVVLVSVSAEIELDREDLYTQWTVDPIMTMPFIVGQFSFEGMFEGYHPITGGFLQLCEANENTLDAAYKFGTYYSYSCSISAISLWDQVKYPFKFYEVFLEYKRDDVDSLYRIPVKINNYRQDNRAVNVGKIQEWKLARRFFLVDAVSTKQTEEAVADYVRYAESIHLRIELKEDSKDGNIKIPYFEITYADISRKDALEGAEAKINFKVSYTMSQGTYYRNFQIATGTLSSFSILYAGFRTYVWSKRAGRLTIDFPTLVNFLFYICGALANCFFVIVFGIGFYFFIFYKRQNVAFLVPPDGKALEEWVALFGASFALKALSLIHMIVMQCSSDIFLIDWERPKGKGAVGAGDSGKKQQDSVSIWRTYFVANEWNEIQTKRKINRVFQIFAVLFFLHVVGFEDTSTKDPDGTVNKDGDVYQSEQSMMFRMALATTIYLVVAVLQVTFFVFIYERFVTDDIREFVDLCSMSNVSVFVMANAEFGYYIHGRSVHGRADVDMKEMNDMIQREENDLVGQRGLVPNTEPQTFIMSLPKRLRQKYETVYMPVQLEGASAASRAEQGQGPLKDKSIEAYNVLNRFLCAFIDHSLRDVDYIVKEKNFLEKILDTEFLELTDKGIFYNDSGHSFDNVLFYGNELALIIFDVLFFCIVDAIAEDFVLAGIITYVATELICLVRDTAGKKNLAKKTLVDEKFLI